MERVRQELESWVQSSPLPGMKITWSIDELNYSATLKVESSSGEDLKHPSNTTLQVFFSASEKPTSVQSDDSRLEAWKNSINGRLQASDTNNMSFQEFLEGLTSQLKSLEENNVPKRNTLQSLKEQIDSWKQKNEFAKMRITATYENEYQINFVVGDEITVSFQILFTTEWVPMIVISDEVILSDFVVEINNQLTARHDAGNPMTITELFDSCARALGFEPGSAVKSTASTSQQDNSSGSYSSGSYASTSGSTVTEATSTPSISTSDENKSDSTREEEVFPTEEDWNNIIIPRMRQYLRDDHLQAWEIDEWLRLLEMTRQESGMFSALVMIRDEILSGAPAPAEIRRFIPKFRTSFQEHKQETQNTGGFDVKDGTPEATQHLLEQWKAIQESNRKKERGFYACPIGKSLYLWSVTMFNFDPESPLGRELMSHALAHHDFDRPYLKIQPTDILFELKFPSNYPHAPPQVRLIRPRFIESNDTALFDDIFEGDDDSSITNATASTNDSSDSSLSTASQAASLMAPGEERLMMQNPLTTSALIFRSPSKWNPNIQLVDLLERMRKCLENKDLRVDMESPMEGLSTIGGFWKSYHCMLASSCGKDDVQMGGKVFLPASALSDLYPQKASYRSHYSYGGYGSSNSDSPMTFEISNEQTGRRTFCGVLEFTAPEGYVVVPRWIMVNLGLQDGDKISLRRVKLPRGTLAKLQPHYSDFLQLANPKAMLEWCLRGYVALTKGDTIEVVHNGKSYKFNVLDVTPGRAISITDSDLSVEFADPVVTVQNEESTLSASAELPASTGTTTGHALPGEAGADYKTCSNCRHHVPVASFSMHEIQCPRINYFCERCQVAVRKADRQKHEEEEHAIVTCICGSSMEKRLLRKHKKEECPERRVQCQFCELQVTYRERFVHENECGSITEECPGCRKRVTRRNQASHKCGESTHTITPPRSGDALFMCELCSAPCENFEELQVHMLTVHYDQTDGVNDQATLSTDSKPTEEKQQ